MGDGGCQDRADGKKEVLLTDAQKKMQVGVLRQSTAIQDSKKLDHSTFPMSLPVVLSPSELLVLQIYLVWVSYFALCTFLLQVVIA